MFGDVTTGAANDIEKATSIAKNMITRFGMSDRFGLAGFATVESQYLEGRTAMNCSDQTAAAIDEEIVKMLKKAYEQAKDLLSDNRELMDKLAGYLIEKETITGKEFMKIFRAEKGIPEPEEEEKDVTGSEEKASGEASVKETVEEKSSEDKSSDDVSPETSEEETGKENENSDVPRGDTGIFSNHTIM